MSFTEEEIKKIYTLAEENDDFLHATNYDSRGTTFTLDRIETTGVKLIVSPIGKKNELKRSNVSNFVDSPCIWIGENGTGRWVGLQGGWPSDKDELEEELRYDSAVKRRDRNHYPNPNIDRPVEFMNLERHRYCWEKPKSGWLKRAQKRIDLYKSLCESYSEKQAAKIAAEVEFDYNGKPKLKELKSKYRVAQIYFVLKVAFVFFAIYGLDHLIVGILNLL